MLINFKADNLELTDNVRAYAQNKVEMLGKLLANIDDENVSYDIELSNGKQQSGATYRADITLHAGSIRLHAIGHGESINAAIDESKDELERRLRREKTKSMTMMRKGKQVIKRLLRLGE